MRNCRYIFFKIIAVPVNNAFKTVQQSAKDKEDIFRRADAGLHAMMDWIVCSKLWNCYNMIMKKKTTENRELRGEQVWTLEQISCSMAVITTRSSG